MNLEDAAYFASLLAAANKVQGRQTQGLTVTTLLEVDGDVRFFGDDSSSITVNVAAVLVLSSTGALLQSDGSGSRRGPGAPTPLPPCRRQRCGQGIFHHRHRICLSWDDGHPEGAYGAREHLYSDLPRAGPRRRVYQAVWVNLDNLEWVQLLPEASSLVRKNYVANSDSASCALRMLLLGDDRNILVDAVGSGSDASPSGVPTDTRATCSS